MVKFSKKKKKRKKKGRKKKGEKKISSSEKFFQFFDFNEHIQKVEIELSHAHIWDMTSVQMLNAVVEKFEAHGVVVEVLGLNERASSTLIDRISS